MKKSAFAIIAALLLFLTSCQVSDTPEDMSPPAISDIRITDTSETSATITWITDEPADAQVECLITDIDYIRWSTPLVYNTISSSQTGHRTSHTMILDELIPCNTYYFRVKSSDALGNQSISEESSFTTQLPEEVGIEFETIETRPYGGRERGVHVVTNDADWETLCDDIGESLSDGIDFSQEMAIAAFQGRMPTGGYAIEIIKVVEDEDLLQVYIEENLHTMGPVTMGATSPYHIIKIPKSDKEMIVGIRKI